MAADPREPYGRMVHDVRLAHEAVRAAAEGRQKFNMPPWEQRDEHQRELDMRIGEAVRDRVLNVGPARGEIVREAWMYWALEQPDVAEHPNWLKSWAELDERDREADDRIYAAVAAAERERIAALMDELAAYYPESVWPPDSDVRDSIGATAMRHAYRNAARTIREPQERSDEKGASDG